MNEFSNRQGGNSEATQGLSQQMGNIVRAFTQVTLKENISLKTFQNTARSTFGTLSGVSVWVDNAGILRTDLRQLTTLLISVITEDEVENLREKTLMFREVLSIDFDMSIQLSNKPLKRPMLEVWTTTKQSEVWVDPTIIPKSDDDAIFYVPYDYCLQKKPIIFSNRRFVNRPEILVWSEPIDTGCIPYMEYKTT